MKNRQNNKKFNLKIVSVILFALIIASGVYYVVGINDLSIKGFVIEKLKNSKKDLNEKSSELELAVMSLESYQSLSKRTKELGMVKVEEINYITNAVEKVAKK